MKGFLGGLAIVAAPVVFLLVWWKFLDLFLREKKNV